MAIACINRIGTNCTQMIIILGKGYLYMTHYYNINILKF